MAQALVGHQLAEQRLLSATGRNLAALNSQAKPRP
jgi:hypothetical protein